VFQGGIANVFRVQCHNLAPFGRAAKRLLQGDFASCVSFAKGMGAAGAIVRTAGCNQAGDITECRWTEQLETLPFSDQIQDVHIA
jgi:hypothetical protein